jgi:hypothetical protein
LLLYSSKPSLGVYQLAGHLLQANKFSGTIINSAPSLDSGKAASGCRQLGGWELATRRQRYGWAAGCWQCGGWVAARRWTAATLRLEGGRCRIVIRSLGNLIGGSLTFFSSFLPPLMERFISFLI